MTWLLKRRISCYKWRVKPLDKHTVKCHNGLFYPYQTPGNSEDRFSFLNTRLSLNFRKQDKKAKRKAADFSFEPMDERW